MSKYSQLVKVSTRDANWRAHLKLPSLLAFLQEAATENADIIGIGRKDILPLGLGWALTRMHLKINALPEWQDSLEIHTWPSAKTKVVAEREFEVEDKTMGKTAVLGRTQWVLINLNTRRLERISAVKNWDAASVMQKAFDEDIFAKIPPCTNAQYSAKCTVRKEDIDINLHVNNAVYLTWAIEAVPNEFLENHIPTELKMHFIKEVSQGNPILSECSFENGMSFHSIKRADTMEECARVNICWTCG